MLLAVSVFNFGRHYDLGGRSLKKYKKGAIVCCWGGGRIALLALELIEKRGFSLLRVLFRHRTPIVPVHAIHFCSRRFCGNAPCELADMPFGRIVARNRGSIRKKKQKRAENCDSR